MTWEDFVKLLAVFVTTIFASYGTLKVTNRKNPSLKDLVESLSVERHDLQEENEAKQRQLDAQAQVIARHDLDLASMNGKLELIERQRVEQEMRHTQNMVAQEARHSDTLANVATEKTNLRLELDRITGRVNEQATRLLNLETENRSLREKTGLCEQLERERDEIAASLKHAEKRIVELEEMIKLLKERKPPPPTTEPDDHTPPAPPRLTIADAAAAEATLDSDDPAARKDEAA